MGNQRSCRKYFIQEVLISAYLKPYGNSDIFLSMGVIATQHAVPPYFLTNGYIGYNLNDH